MSEQEQEHLDHVAGSASEFQNCFEEASISRCHVAGQARKAIDDVLTRGRFAVVSTSPFFCRVTDALVGVVEHLRGDYDSREAADAAAQVIYAAEYACGLDIGEALYVLPRLPQAVVQSPVDNDDVPF